MPLSRLSIGLLAFAGMPNDPWLRALPYEGASRSRSVFRLSFPPRLRHLPFLAWLRRGGRSAKSIVLLLDETDRGVVRGFRRVRSCRSINPLQVHRWMVLAMELWICCVMSFVFIWR